MALFKVRSYMACPSTRNPLLLILVLSSKPALSLNETTYCHKWNQKACISKTYSCLFQHIIIANHHTTIKIMAFRQFIPEITHPAIMAMNSIPNIQIQASFLNNFGINLNPYSFSRNIQHNNQTIENIKININPPQSQQLNIYPSSLPSLSKVSKLNDRQRQYKRSTNNSHKKFICVARRLLMRFLQNSEKKRFDTNYQIFKNSRVYYFIILAHAKILLSEQNLRDFTHQFLLQMSNKIEFYKNEISKTNNHNFINYRHDQIADIQFAIQAFDLYFKDKTQQAIEIIYKREKTAVVKKNQYEQTIKIIGELEDKLRNKEIQKEKRNNVIILKQNNLELNRNQTNTCLAQIKEVRFQNFYPFSFQPKQEAVSASQIQYKIENKEQISLIELQNSYPIYEYFYEIMFPYQVGGEIMNIREGFDGVKNNEEYIDQRRRNQNKEQKLVIGQTQSTSINKLFFPKTRSLQGNDNLLIEDSL